MSYITKLKVLQESGLKVDVVDENVGTGNNSETNFDLDNTNICEGSYTLSHAPSGSNSFTELTETTHYALDKDSGRIVLTSAGVAEVGTDVIYASYSYNEFFNDAHLTEFITASDAEVDEVTGRYWGSPRTKTEYISGRRNPIQYGRYPVTDEPYMGDWDEPDVLQLHYLPVYELTSISFLKRGAGWSKVYSYDGSSYTDNTDEANTAKGTSFYAFSSSSDTDDYIYFGSQYKFYGISTRLSQIGVGGAVSWEYYNGSSWVGFTPAETDTGASNFTAEGKFTFTPSDLDSWSKTSVNSSPDYYYIRGKVSTQFTTAPKIYEAYMDQDSTVEEDISLKDVDADSDGRVSFLNRTIPDGVRNIKIVYRQGTTEETPQLIKDLSATICTIRMFSFITGGSYNDATSYSLGSKSVSIGEVYVNVKEVVRQAEEKYKRLLRLVGGRHNISSI